MCSEGFLIKMLTQQSHTLGVTHPQKKKKTRSVRAAGVKRLTFGNAQPQLLLCEATEGCFQSLGHHLFTSWCEQGDVSTLWICQSQTANAVKPWTEQFPYFGYCSRGKRATKRKHLWMCFTHTHTHPRPTILRSDYRLSLYQTQSA